MSDDNQGQVQVGKAQRIQWTAFDVPADQLGPMADMMVKGLGLVPFMDQENFKALALPNGSLFELYAPGSMEAPWREQGNSVGFLVDDIEAASANLEKYGATMVSPVNRFPKMGEDGGDYAVRYFKAPNGRIYTISQNRGLTSAE